MQSFNNSYCLGSFKFSLFQVLLDRQKQYLKEEFYKECKQPFRGFIKML